MYVLVLEFVEVWVLWDLDDFVVDYFKMYIVNIIVFVFEVLGMIFFGLLFFFVEYFEKYVECDVVGEIMCKVLEDNFFFR